MRKHFNLAGHENGLADPADPAGLAGLSDPAGLADLALGVVTQIVN